MINKNKKPIALYVHIPFCERKCLYCSFVSFVDLAKEKDYFLALKNQINAVSPEILKTKTIGSIYFGGGTPSFVHEQHVCEILELIKNKFELTTNCEISIECNPNSSYEEKLKAYLNAGFNRISFGVQSFCDNELKAIGRLHNSFQAEQAIMLAHKVGFKNISCDLLVGIPFQTKETFLTSINKATSLPINHISAYSLILEEETPLFNLVKDKKVSIADEEKSVELIKMLEKKLEILEFKKYEISNFAKSGYECKQNISYWKCEEYLGFGVAAHGYVNGERIENTRNLNEFISGNYVKNKHFVSIEEKIEERIMLGLRMVKGFDLKTFKEDFAFDFLETKKTEIELLKNKRLIKIKNNHLSLTKKGFFVCNLIILRLI